MCSAFSLLLSNKTRSKISNKVVAITLFIQISLALFTLSHTHTTRLRLVPRVSHQPASAINLSNWCEPICAAQTPISCTQNCQREHFHKTTCLHGKHPRTRLFAVSLTVCTKEASTHISGCLEAHTGEIDADYKENKRFRFASGCARTPSDTLATCARAAPTECRQHANPNVYACTMRTPCLHLACAYTWRWRSHRGAHSLVLLLFCAPRCCTLAGSK